MSGTATGSSATSAPWQRLPEDLQEIVARELDRSAIDQRADIAKLSDVPAATS